MQTVLCCAALCCGGPAWALGSARATTSTGRGRRPTCWRQQAHVRCVWGGGGARVGGWVGCATLACAGPPAGTPSLRPLNAPPPRTFG